MSGEEYTEFSPTIGALAAAIAKAQGVMRGARRDALNPHLKSKYADLESTWEAIREALSANGLAVVQYYRPSHDGVHMVTMLVHASGEWIRGAQWLPLTKADAQGYGSAGTYARRYGLQAITGIAPTDDDGEAAVRQPAPARQAPASAQVDPAPPGAALNASTLSSLLGRADFQATLQRAVEEKAITRGQAKDLWAAHKRLEQSAGEA